MSHLKVAIKVERFETLILEHVRIAISRGTGSEKKAAKRLKSRLKILDTEDKFASLRHDDRRKAVFLIKNDQIKPVEKREVARLLILGIKIELEAYSVEELVEMADLQ